MSTKRLSLLVVSLVLLTVPALAQKSGKGPSKGTLDAPTLGCATATGSSISITVTAGPSGAPAGVSVHWMLESEFLLTGWPADGGYQTPSFCEASFSGNANGHAYAIQPGGSITIELGDIIFDTPGASSACENVPLSCGERYVFRAFAHGTSEMFKSDWSAIATCATSRCGSGACTYTQGYWKTHGPVPTGNNSNEWPVTSLTLGSVTYSDLQLLAILDKSAAGGNGLVSLAHQLIAARLNEANGVNVSAIAGALAQADAMIGSLVVPPVGSGYLGSGTTSGVSNVLADFNEGLIGPGHCEN